MFFDKQIPVYLCSYPVNFLDTALISSYKQAMEKKFVNKVASIGIGLYQYSNRNEPAT